MKNLFALIAFAVGFSMNAQAGYWQQHADYTMAIDVEVENFTYSGEQSLAYTNNSPDTLQRVFYHLYYNAFKPGSGLEAASRNAYSDKRNMSKNLLSLEMHLLLVVYLNLKTPFSFIYVPTFLNNCLY